MGEGLKCYVCNRENNTGIVVLNEYICGSCEKEMLYIETDQLKYELFKKKIKEIWKKGLQVS
ncbi:hypothetical protein Amet_0079 [Alkaliphilus metalliredigens QYMF]|uniref:Inhibitor of sigma-G Gin n=1 Tax=Alkaliphilus metalliredigens (strain QYMF) TaxID=293826 RepID=A6TJF4_ALKMQ|nr:sigma factor G inhibitor Gin [Alkaliphilus metalliredigens]ABR46322.1 hypothetical protein Amet_0079 [Alkaliphilus metalliredigens QYMF]